MLRCRCQDLPWACFGLGLEG